MKKFRNIALCLLIVVILAIASVFAYYNINMSAVSDDDTLKEVTIEAGSIESIGITLKENNLIKDVTIFKIYTRLKDKSNLKAGIYNLSENMTVEEIVEILEKGSTYNPDEISITFKEGINIRKVAKSISETTNNSYEDVLELMNDTKYINVDVYE